MRSPNPPRTDNDRTDAGQHLEAGGNGDIYSLFWREDVEERRGLRFSLVGAVIVHAVLLLITFPNVYSGEIDDHAKKQRVFVVQNPRFKPPEVPVTQLPQVQARRVPIPDPDPDDPEPLRLDDIRNDVRLPNIDPDLIITVPSAPPVPASNEPLVIGGDVVAPVREHFVAPKYTEMARRARITGSVVLQTVITREGRVTRIEVLKSLPLGLADEAIHAVEQWRYKPATLNGKPVDVYLNLSVIFNLQ